MYGVVIAITVDLAKFTLPKDNEKRKYSPFHAYDYYYKRVGLLGWAAEANQAEMELFARIFSYG